MDKRKRTPAFEADQGAGRRGEAMSAGLIQFRAGRPEVKEPDREPDGATETNLRPALFAGYRTLSGLRHDYPLVLLDGATDGAFVRPLLNVIDGVLQEIAPRGIAGERLRKQVLRLEREIRILVSRGVQGSLSELWDLATANLLSAVPGAPGKSLEGSVSRARAALRFDGKIIGCGEETPAAVLGHAWEVLHTAKTIGFRARADELVRKLADILKADFMRSREGRSPENLKRAFGRLETAFDFEAMSDILTRSASPALLPESRRRRIRDVLLILQSQRFFPPSGKVGARECPEETHVLVFESCTAAVDAFRKRLSDMAALIKALLIAELEIANRYKEPKHDTFFKRFNGASLSAEDLALFPPMLVCLRDGRCDAAEQAKIVDVLSSCLPIKILVQTDDILAESEIWNGTFFPHAGGSRLARMAVGLNGAFVLQAASSHLYRLSDLILRGFTYRGPALFSIFSGTGGASRTGDSDRGLAPYLAAAAAVESRAFPIFSYNPDAGPDWSSRFQVGENPQAQWDWPIHRLSYQDENLQAVSGDIAFTFVDFVAGDRRYAGRFASVPRAKWREAMIPLAEHLKPETAAAHAKAPYILMLDDDDILHRVIVEDDLVRAARRCREVWRSLQELGGINNSHAKKFLKSERERWEREKQIEIAALNGQLGDKGQAPAAAPKLAVPGAVPQQPAEAQEVVRAEESPADESYIETPRCTTCEECIRINSRMFAYNDNKQAYIADLGAGTYRQLVEAAEACQVAIIHPGKPKNLNEPDLDALIQRAAAFE